MWWKCTSIILIVYSIIMGLLVPLKPGITDVSPRRAFLGQQVTLDIKGYNAHYSEYPLKSLRTWLKLDSTHSISHIEATAKGDNELELIYQIPTSFPTKAEVGALTLIIESQKDGLSVLPNALIVRNGNVPEQKDIDWKVDNIQNLTSIQSFRFPYRNILQETIRSLYYHVPLWFAMMALLALAAWSSVRYLVTGNIEYEYKAEGLTFAAILFGLLGLLTGAIWATYTWGQPWSWDVKQNMAAISILMYAAYFILRDSLRDQDRRARLASVYNIFSFVCLIPLLFIIPRLVDSLHPGSGGNPAFGGEDLDHTMRLVFYPAIIGWGLFGYWLADIRTRLNRIKSR